MLKKIGLVLAGALWVAGLAGCGDKVDPDIRRGDTFFQNKKYYEAFKAYEQGQKKNPALFDQNPEARKRFKDAYYYHGGSFELAGSKEAAMKYYELGFALVPDDPGMCDKIAKYYWEQEDFEKSSKYFNRLVELDAEAPDSKQKWVVLGQDYYALGYSLMQEEKWAEGIEAMQQCIKADPKGEFVAKAKSAIASAKYKMKK